jgi:hypothetical protein
MILTTLVKFFLQLALKDPRIQNSRFLNRILSSIDDEHISDVVRALETSLAWRGFPKYDFNIDWFQSK